MFPFSLPKAAQLRFAFRWLIAVAMIVPSIASAQDSGNLDQAERASRMRPRVGDRVVLKVAGEPTLSDVATVDETGRIALPKIGLIQADAMPVPTLRDTIRTKIESYVR